MKKRRIFQILPVIVSGDAVSNDARALERLLKGAGFRTGIYAESVDGRLPRRAAAEISSLPKLRDDDVLIYHASTGTHLNYDLRRLRGRKIVIYHNITPPEFFAGISPAAERIARFGYEGIRFLADYADYCICDSEYNRQQLIGMGYRCPMEVCPILIPYADYNVEADRKTLDRYRGDGWTNLLFIGRISPNKKQEDVIRAFARYSEKYNPKTRLILAGNADGMEAYREKLVECGRALGVEERVIITGKIPFEEILAYYRLADVLVCMSEHEGFCVPLVEAMHFRVPIVAYGAAAVPETLGKGGVLLEDKDPDRAADAIDRVMRDAEVRRRMMEGQKEILAALSMDAVGDRMLSCLKRAIG